MDQTQRDAIVNKWGQRPKCSLCANLVERSVCRGQGSPHFDGTVSPTDSCNVFIVSRAQALQAEGMNSMAKGDEDVARGLFDAALNEPMPADERAKTLLFRASCSPLGDDYWSDWSKEIREFTDQALAIEVQNRYGAFDEPHMLVFFREMDFVMAIRAAELSDAGSHSQASELLEPVLARYDALPMNPLLATMQAFIYQSCLAASALKDKNAKAAAEHYLQRMQQTVGAGVRDEEGVDFLKRATNNVDTMRSTAKGGCYVATAVYGPDSPKLAPLRWLRDEVLLKHLAGRAFVRLYYRYGPALARLTIARGWAVRGMRRVLDILVSMTERAQNRP